LLSVAIDGATQPLRSEGRKLTVPLTPGAHAIKLNWRDAAGMAANYAAPRLDLGAPAVNAFVELAVPRDRVTLLTFGPLMGPAVLLWGVLIVTIGLAVVAGRLTDTPLKTSHWIILGLGLSQSSMAVAAIVAMWFIAMAIRRRAPLASSPMNFNAYQILLLAFTLFAAASLFSVLKNGLLGYPNMLVDGNGSSAFLLRWYQDRIEGVTPEASMLSIPVAAYRLLMLVWALWLAVSITKWIRWGWECYSTGTYWMALPRPVLKDSKNEAAAAGKVETAKEMP